MQHFLNIMKWLTAPRHSLNLSSALIHYSDEIFYFAAVKTIIFYLNFRSFYTNNCSPAIEPNHLQQCRQPKYLHTYLISIIITNYYFPPPNLILLKSPFKTHHPPPNILTLCFYNVHTASTTY